MPTLEQLDPSTPVGVQFQQQTESIVLINTFTVPREEREKFLAQWREDALYMKAQPGFISTQLYQGTADSQLVVNVAVWESSRALAAAHMSPEFQAKTAQMADGIVSRPHIFQKVKVDGVCVA